MKQKRLSILGSEGQMGQCFYQHFLHSQYEVICYDKNSPPPYKPKSKKEKTKAKHAKSLKEAVSQAEYVLVCVPTPDMSALIDSASKEMKKGSYLIEISSQKSKIFPTLLEISSLVHPVSLHPMFGPEVNPKDQNIILVPVKEEKKEKLVAESLFPESRWISLDVKEHDKKMALILGLPRLLSLCLTQLMLKEKDYSLLNKISGTTFRVQKVLIESMMHESPELIQTLISNPELKETSKEFLNAFKETMETLNHFEIKKVLESFQNSQRLLAQKIQLKKVYKKFVSCAKILE